jgi:hypothetical protein
VSLDIKNGLVPTFGRHETFTLRYAWLKRGYDAVAKPYEWCRHRPDYEPYIFEEPDAHHRLGVGKNMAKSIRFWLQACRVVEEVPVFGQRHRVGVPTRFGGALLGDSEKVGLDPYTEQLGSWWLLHWMMLSPGGYLPVWWIIFHTLPAVTFTTEQLVEHVQAQVEATSAWQARRSVHPSTLRKDVLALLRNYAGTTGGRRRELVDDVLDAPFVPLTLIRPAAEVNTFRFGVGPKPGLPPAVAAFACLDFLARTHSTGRQALVATLATEQGGPGRAFKLTERDLSELLTQAAAETPDLLQMTSTAGSDAVVVPGVEQLELVAARILYRYYTAVSTASEPNQPYTPERRQDVSAGA